MNTGETKIPLTAPGLLLKGQGRASAHLVRCVFSTLTGTPNQPGEPDEVTRVNDSNNLGTIHPHGHRWLAFLPDGSSYNVGLVYLCAC
ncbi:hypothetical protein RRG08_038822 [Elysia crispata]|uniref:Uncharacterized protein n=1 Tax=Elysia crispata TaxID=231223 RepID=A0AAE1D4C8_9GAST|nr:hypothetical protein RRG08_038822 [Elysia crispata]